MGYMGWWKQTVAGNRIRSSVDGAPPVDKVRLIDEIVAANPSASRHWLDTFTDSSLRRYLAHLEHALEPRGRQQGRRGWMRDAETPAVVTRRPAA